MSSISSIKFLVNEDGHEFPICQMSEPETFAISVCVDSLLPRIEKGDCWYEVDVCLLDEWEEDDDEGPPYGLVRCLQMNPAPNDGSKMESEIPHPLPMSLIEKLSGKTFQIYPIQYGVNPWGKNVTVTFETVM